MRDRPEKTSERGRINRHLSARVFRAALVCCIVLGAVALLAGLAFYTYSLSRQLIDKAYSISHIAALTATKGAEAPELASKTMEIYRSLTPEQRADVNSASYRERFAPVEQSYSQVKMWHMLREFRESADVRNVYLGMFDRETSALVLICDPTVERENHSAGLWKEVPQKEIAKFLEYDGEGMLYYIGYWKEYGWMCTAGVPVVSEEDGAGETVAFLLTDVTLTTLVTGIRAFALQFSILQLALTALIAFLLTRRMRRTVVEPVNAIADAARGYAEDKRSGKSEKHFSYLNIHTGDEIENLSKVMEEMERDIAAFETDLTEATAERERISTELNMAAAIQTQVLPGEFPAFPDRREFTVFASMTPAKEVGGDFYDFFMVDRDHLALIIGDVSGKGIPAALFMMTSRTMLRDAAMSGADPAAVLSRVNAQLCENNQECMFVTVWLGILEISTGKLTCADAGHEPMLLQQDGAWELLPKDGAAAALGVFEPEFIEPDTPFAYRNRELTLRPGDGVFLYTDGVNEAMTEAGKQFGYERLRTAVETSPSCAPEELLPHVHRAVNEYVCGAPQYDDITMLALRFFGENGEKPADL